jgi:hypothetical protein
MKKYLLAIAVVAALYVGLSRTNGPLHFTSAPTAQSTTAPTARTEGTPTTFGERNSGAQVSGEGVVIKLLSDDTDGSRHQRFILTLASGQTLLVAHNIDLAPRIGSLKSGDSVAFSGVYEWNAKGGVIHWTHHDPNGRHQPGWLKHGGQTYQ